MQTLIPLNRGELKITQAKFYRVSGQSTQHQGVLPDVEFPEVYDTDKSAKVRWKTQCRGTKSNRPCITHATQVQTVLPMLVDKHRDRVATNPDFEYLRALDGQEP